MLFRGAFRGCRQNEPVRRAAQQIAGAPKRALMLPNEDLSTLPLNIEKRRSEFAPSGLIRVEVEKEKRSDVSVSTNWSKNNYREAS